MLGGFLGGLANLGTAYGGYLGAQQQSIANQLNQFRLQQALQQQTASQDAWKVAQQGLNQYFPGGGFGMLGAQPGTATPSATPTPGALPTAPVTPVQAQPLPAPLSPLQTAAGGPLGQFGIPGGGPLGTPGLPGMSGFGGGGALSAGLPSLGGLQGSPAGGPGLPSFAGSGITPTGLPQEQASLAGQPTLGLGRQAAPLPDITIPQVNTRAEYTPTTPPSMQGPSAGVDVFTGVSTLGPPQRAGYTPITPPQLQGLGEGGIMQPAGGFGLPSQYTPTPPQAPAAPGTAQVPGTADTGARAQVPGTADTGGAVQVPGSYDTPGGAIRPPEQQMLNLIKKRESDGDYSNVNRDSGASGAYQFLDSTWRETAAASGVGGQYAKASQAPKEVQDYNALFLLRRQGTRPWAASGPYPAVAGIRGGVDVNGAVLTSRQMWNQSTTPQEKQGSSIGTMSILQRYPFLANAIGTFDMDRLVKTIDQTYPDESPGVKLGIFNNLFNLLQPIAKEQYAKTIELVKADISEQERAETQRETARFHAAEERHWAATEGGGGTIVQGGTPDAPVYYRVPRSGPAQMVEGIAGPVTRLPTAGSAGTAAGGLLKDELYSYTDKEGNQQQVTLRPKKGMAGYVIAAGPDQGKDFVLPEGAKDFIHISATTFGGGRAQAQVGRQLTGGAEVMVDLGNVADMPVGTTVGPLGTVEAGTSLSGALKGDLARTLTSEDEINMKQAMSGVGRELSTLMNPVYGGKWASDQLEPLIPKTGYTVANSLYGIARIRQSAENALTSAIKSPLLSKEQKDYARQLQQQMAEAIPWTVADVQAWIRAGDPQESFGDFVRRERVTGAGKSREGRAAPAATQAPATAQPQAAPSAQPSAGAAAPTAAADRKRITDIPGANLNDADGTGYRDPTTGEIWVKQGSQAVKAPAGAVETPGR